MLPTLAAYQLSWFVSLGYNSESEYIASVAKIKLCIKSFFRFIADFEKSLNGDKLQFFQQTGANLWASLQLLSLLGDIWLAKKVRGWKLLANGYHKTKCHIKLSCLRSHFLKYFINDCFIFIFYFIYLTNIWFLYYWFNMQHFEPPYRRA